MPLTNGSAPEQQTFSPSLSRQGSHPMLPPAHSRSSTLSSPVLGDNTGVGDGPGPLRHPRPMTAADIHLELEKEQEAVVNRLTRELSLLRQQTVSVASTSSSASANIHEPTDGQHTSGFFTPGSRNRSSSTLSSRSFAGGSSLPIGSVAGIAPSRDSTAPQPPRQSMEYHRPSRSREPSIMSRGPSGTTSPALSSSFQQPGEHFPFQSHRPSHAIPSLSSNSAQAASLSFINSHQREPPSSGTATRYEEVTVHRAELDAARRENELLRRRIRELEATLREYRRPEVGGDFRSPEATSELEFRPMPDS
ncbi:hypothetical protein LOZ12_003761 [Ophidiomyces ophidiicola]|nr:hypothetical protein LOZ62_004821 [Ophidiomyces ophidiicola]KAI1978065.1 hypothetical protein LOZ55_002943 [Ophidiomyces ophidiicola]KAI1985664.1 hypothetical protein LOZ51_006283 [Ophidiomyces ophidiicola]KAI1995062.1 hypothetical protein LOZ54_000733 [Ophidiomyces ophidiicola]KAI2048375.1 hypothetical protein LOZ38_004343 [Ophidiomyces ophidiicola]